MEDALSQVSGRSNATNRNRTKICAYDGKSEGPAWSRHYDRHHPDMERKEWVPGEALLGEPYCDNWFEISVDKTIDPINARPEFKPSFRANSKKGSLRGSVIAPSDIGDRDVDMDITEEEKKEDVAVPSNFGNLESNSASGKRLSPTTPIGLEQQVIQELLQQQGEPIVTDSIPVPQSKRSNTGGSMKSMKSSLSAGLLREQQMQQEAIDASTIKVDRYHGSQQEFLIPLPVTQTVYRDQGMRDSEAVQKLIVLNAKTGGVATVRLLELIKLAPFLTQPLVSSYIEQNKTTLTSIRDLVLLAHTKAQVLSVEDATAIAFASVLFGDSVWASIPKMFDDLEQSKLGCVLRLLRPLLSAKFNDTLALWFWDSWRYIEEQTLGLFRALKESNLEKSLSSDIATISRMVKIADVNEYLLTIEVFSKAPSFKLVMDTITDGAAKWKAEQQLSFDGFAALIDFLTESGNTHIIKANTDDLLELPMCQWMEKLKTLKAASTICNVGSVQHRLNELQQWYVPLLKNHQTDLLLSGDPRYKRAFHGLANAPNELQFANAQYAALSLRFKPKQMWCIPSGQGKSRILLTEAVILLLAGSTTKVHLVYDSDYLMERDKKQFKLWLTRLSLEDAVEYHVGIDFDCQPGDVILVDEADELVFGNPEKFLLKTKGMNCICLTATPDNEDNKGVEREVLKGMGFSLYDGLPEIVVEGQLANTVTTVSEVKMNGILQFGVGLELISFVQKELQEHAVLIPCPPELQQLLINAKIPYILMTDGQFIDDEFLRTLDNRGPDGTHALIIAPDSFGTRGLDYRSPSKGITLIIAKSFSNQRQAIQGLNRVGRYGDPCKRFILKDVALIDEQEKARYTASLMQFMQRHQKKTLMAPLPSKEEKKTTTTSAKATPVVGKKPKKVKKGGKGKTSTNQGSQSVLTVVGFNGHGCGNDATKRQIQMVGLKPLSQTQKKALEREENDGAGGKIVLTDSQILGLD